MPKHCENCRCDEIAAKQEYGKRMAEVARRLEAGDKFSDEELRYSAGARCDCGAGLAYPKDSPLNGSWDCSDILTGRAIPSGQTGAKKHTGKLPFTFYKVKSEDQPSAGGRTTRPDPVSA